MEKKFDWIIIVDVLHDLPNPDQCLADVKRVLQDDGIVSAIDPYIETSTILTLTVRHLYFYKF
jgi:ubiquinone/menaquinone biosynthesis C-methylase UbiE